MSFVHRQREESSNNMQTLIADDERPDFGRPWHIDPEIRTQWMHEQSRIRARTRTESERWRDPFYSPPRMTVRHTYPGFDQ
jgi:hypothetical protein